MAVITDLNGEGLPDVVVETSDSQAVNILVNQGDGSLKYESSWAAENPNWLFAGPFLEPGKPSILAGYSLLRARQKQ